MRKAAAPMTLGLHAERDPDRPAIVMVETGEIVTYGRLEQRSASCAGTGCGSVRSWRF